MSKAAKIERQQKAFLKAMKEKFAADPDPSSLSKPKAEESPAQEICPMCSGHGYRKKAFCHTCGGTGWRRKVRS